MSNSLQPHARRLTLLLLVLPALALSPLAQADPVTDLRQELEALKSGYEARIAGLEARIAVLEASSAAAPPAPAEQLPAASAPARGGANAFNPSISLILGGSYTQTSLDPATWHVAGFIPGGDDAGPGARSWKLGESELGISANIDPYFFGNLTVSMAGDNSVSVEEAFVRSTALPAGLTLKAGRFFSGIGYLNEVHAHAWDFVDQPLAYQALLGNQRAQDGVQLKWLAPTDLFAEFGVEAGSGRAFPATTRHANGLNAATAFVHLGDDVGDSASWRAGLSYLHADAEDRRYEDVDAAGDPVSNAFNGRSETWVADFTWKWAPHGNATARQWKLQGEYLHRRERGDLIFDADAAALRLPYLSRQAGWYLQTVYQFAPRWRVGLRYDALDSGAFPLRGALGGGLTSADFPLLLAARPRRSSLMLDWSPSEFSRLRAQFARDASRAVGTDNQLQLQYIYSLGAHGAHKF